MAENRPPPPESSDPAKADAESVPRHRVVWDQASLVPPDPAGEMRRGTIRMVRPNLSVAAVPQAEDASVDIVVEASPTTARVPPAGAPAMPPPIDPVLMQTVAMVHAPPRPPQSAPPAAFSQSTKPPGARAPVRIVDPRLVLLAEPDSERAASFRLLRDNLVAKGLPRVLAVSSAATDDGKTTCAINLALALAEQSPARILLLDGNFFVPSLGGIFFVDEYTPTPAGLDLPGVAPYKLAELTPSLHVAAIALRRGGVAPRFDKQGFDILLDRLCRIGYDHIIVDAPAIEGSPMVSQLLGGVDGVLLAVRSGRTTTRALRRAIDAIPGRKALGVALMDAEPV